MKYHASLFRRNKNICRKFKGKNPHTGKDEPFCSLSCFDWENDGRKVFDGIWAPIVDEISLLADAKVGVTDLQWCDINSLAEQGVVPCEVIDLIGENCHRYGLLSYVSFIMIIKSKFLIRP